MKRLFTLIALLGVMLGAAAQTENVYVWKNGVYTAFPINEVDSITFTLPSTPEDEPNDFPDAGEGVAVDLGLPSGTLWADRNVGADSPEGYGDYFAWGETEPKSTYNWDTYKWCNGSSNTMTKYCTESFYGYNYFTDSKTTLEPSDDAATANWGEKWCMPTKSQLSELLSKCTWAWTTQNGVKGYKVTGPNGNYIFLPAAGYRHSSLLDDAGSYGCYWPSSLGEGGDANYSYCLYYGSDDLGLYVNLRYCGHTVRAVVR